MQWKIGAIKIAITLERRGYVTRADFKAARIDHRRWVPQGWLTCRDGQYHSGPDIPNFRRQHPKVWIEIEADADEWMPGARAPEPAQQPLFGEHPARRA